MPRCPPSSAYSFIYRCFSELSRPGGQCGVMVNGDRRLLFPSLNMHHSEAKARLPESPAGGLEDDLEIHSSVNYRFLLLGRRNARPSARAHLYTH